MKNYVQETLRRLVQLNDLEDRLELWRIWKDESLNEQALIESLRANLLPTVLQHHDRLRVKGKRSVAEARHGVCSGCHMTLAVGVLALLYHRDQIQKCGNCGRYIFVPEDEEVTPGGNESPAKAPITRARPRSASTGR